MIRLEAAVRLKASGWFGAVKMQLPDDIRNIVEATLHKLAAKYPSIAHIEIREGDAEIMDASGSLATKSNDAVYLHPHIWLDHGKLKKHAQDWHEAMVDPNIEGIITHEVGHILDGQVLRKLGSKKYNALIGKHIRDFSGIYNDESPSAYGQENVYEFLAEAFTAHFMGKHALTLSNDLTKQSLKVCNAIWADFNKVLGAK